MGLLSLPFTTGRLHPAGSSPSPHAAGLPAISKRFIVKLVVIFLAVIFLSMASAAQRDKTQSISNDKQNGAVRFEATPAAEPADNSAANAAVTEEDNVVNGTSSNANSNSGGATNQSDTNIQVEVNGQPIDVPENGSTHRTITSDGGTTSVDITQNQSATGTSFRSSVSSTNVNNSSPSSTNQNVKIEQHSGGP